MEAHCKIKKNLRAFPDNVNNAIINFLNTYADLMILTFRIIPLDKWV